ncbi:MAG: GNAT family N-acetyltransferase [Hyphomicrobiales bacterium]
MIYGSGDNLACDIGLPGLDGEGSLTIRSSAGPIRVTVTSSFEALRPNWLALQQAAACSYSQSYYWAEGWQRLVGLRKGHATVLVHGATTNRETLFILPFDLAKVTGQRVIGFIGQEHANYNSGLFHPDLMRKLTRSDIDAILCTAADLMGGADAAIFEHQPKWLGDTLNPLALMPHSPSANSGYAVVLQRDFEALYRTRLSKRRRKAHNRSEKHLETLGHIELAEARDATEAAAWLDICFAQKRQRFLAKGIRDSFEDPCYRDFYKEMAAIDTIEHGRLRVSCLKVAGEVAATIGCAVLRDRQYEILSSIAPGPIQSHSPGQIMERDHLRKACAEGFAVEDFGIGAGPHKDVWCDRVIELFDSHLPLSPKGHALCAYEALKNTSKRLIKTNPVLWSAYQAARKQLRGSR